MGECIGKLYYERGIRFFELGKYEEAVSDWIQAYNLDYGKENIIKTIYDCFVVPNEQEFRKNYNQNSSGFTWLPYEACSLDFIPVAERVFYIFDREEKIFQGLMTLEEEAIQGSNVEFSSILFTDTWDVREILPDLKENKRDVVYVLLNEFETKFVSFLKLPYFKELYLENVIVFQNESVMQIFFSENIDFYLPKQIVTEDAEKYWGMIKSLHEERICHLGEERRNIFLSICIPSYNRGEIALSNVRHLLSCPYDSEIEIIVSNNGSIKGLESYEIIRNMSDSRVRYHEFAENQGYAANILKVCDMARGEYAVIVSDEDIMILDEFGEYLNFIKTYPNCGVYVSGVEGRMIFERDGLLGGRIEAIATVSTWSYMTGFTYNMKLCHRIKALERLEELRCGDAIDWQDEAMMSNKEGKRNLYLEILTHDCLAAMCCRYSDVGVMKLVLWDAEINNTDPEPGFGPYYLPENRIEKQNSFMDFCNHLLDLKKEEFVRMFLIKCRRTHALIKLSFSAFPDEMLKLGSEWEIQAWIYREHIKYLDAFPISLTEDERREIKVNIAKME